MDNRKPIISIRNVYKRFGGSVVAVDNANLEIGEGEFFALLGPSGCGKTTLLRMLAGFEIPTEGEIIIDGQPHGGRRSEPAAGEHGVPVLCRVPAYERAEAMSATACG